MKKKIQSFVILILLIFAIFSIVDYIFKVAPMVKGNTIYVGGGGSDNHSKIQEGVDAAIDGDTVYVYNGTYIENVVVNKRIYLTGEDKNSTLINGFGNDDVVTVIVNSVNITGFSIRNSGFNDAGIRLSYVNRCNIADNILYNNYYGIELICSNETSITNNLLSNNEDGIYLGGSNRNNISGNSISSFFWGISLFNSNGNNIIDNHASPYMDYGIRLDSSHQNNIVNNNVSTNKDYGIYFHSSKGNNVTYNNASNCDYGIYLEYSDENNITGNNASNCIFGIYLSYSNITKITENTLFLNGIGICIIDSDHNNATNNNASNNNGGIYLGYSSSTKITDNILLDNWAGILLDFSSVNEIIDNTMTSGGFLIERGDIEHWNTHNISTSNTLNGKPIYYWKNQTGGKIPLDAGQVILANCSNVRIEDLILTNGSVGIELGFSSITNIKGNNLSWNHYYGMYIHNSSNNIISENNASNNRLYYGIYLSGSNANNISNNEASSNGGNGIYLRFSSENAILSNNISSNINNGIALSSSNWVNITDNTVSNNDCGIRLWSSINNSIYHNNIVTNTNQAYDYTINGNQWDDGYPSGGNFWSDYSGIDLNSTPAQDVPPPDEIGDTPYVIDSDSQDDYPLMSPIGNRIFLYEGWNLISIPFIQPDGKLETVLSSINDMNNAVQWYNISDSVDPWKHNVTKKPSHLNDLDSIYHTMGFWIHIIEPGGILFQYPGTQPLENQTISLNKGWNLVGYPSITNHNRTIGLNNLEFGVDVNAIQWYDASTKTWRFMGPNDSFVPGRGYWVHSKVEASWEVPL